MLPAPLSAGAVRQDSIADPPFLADESARVARHSFHGHPLRDDNGSSKGTAAKGADSLFEIERLQRKCASLESALKRAKQANVSVSPHPPVHSAAGLEEQRLKIMELQQELKEYQVGST
jgi:hypothetical protein